MRPTEEERGKEKRKDPFSLFTSAERREKKRIPLPQTLFWSRRYFFTALLHFPILSFPSTVARGEIERERQNRRLHIHGRLHSEAERERERRGVTLIYIGAHRFQPAISAGPSSSPLNFHILRRAAAAHPTTDMERGRKWKGGTTTSPPLFSPTLRDRPTEPTSLPPSLHITMRRRRRHLLLDL